MPGFCRDCLAAADTNRCAACDSARVIRHPELFDLTLAHIDCDAFYASVEKRDRPERRNGPLSREKTSVDFASGRTIPACV